jgi:hypothetical protein
VITLSRARLAPSSSLHTSSTHFEGKRERERKAKAAAEAAANRAPVIQSEPEVDTVEKSATVVEESAASPPTSTPVITVDTSSVDAVATSSPFKLPSRSAPPKKTLEDRRKEAEENHVSRRAAASSTSNTLKPTTSSTGNDEKKAAMLARIDKIDQRLRKHPDLRAKNSDPLLGESLYQGLETPEIQSDDDRVSSGGNISDNYEEIGDASTIPHDTVIRKKP